MHPTRPGACGPTSQRRRQGDITGMLASCENCAFSEGKMCTLGQKLKPGELLCGKYSMTVAFREELLRLARADLAKEINQAKLMVQLRKAEERRAFAG